MIDVGYDGLMVGYLSFSLRFGNFMNVLVVNCT